MGTWLVERVLNVHIQIPLTDYVGFFITQYRCGYCTTMVASEYPHRSAVPLWLLHYYEGTLKVQYPLTLRHSTLNSMPTRSSHSGTSQYETHLALQEGTGCVGLFMLSSIQMTSWWSLCQTLFVLLCLWVKLIFLNEVWQTIGLQSGLELDQGHQSHCLPFGIWLWCL